MSDKGEVYLAQARKYEEINNFAEAFGAYLRWAEAQQTPEAYLEIGKFCEKYAEFRKAASMYSTALEIDPSNTEAKIRLKAVQSEILAIPRFSLKEMQSLLADGLIEKAVESFVQAIGAAVVDQASVAEIVRLLWCQGAVIPLRDRLVEMQRKGEFTEKSLLVLANLLANAYASAPEGELEEQIKEAMEAGLTEVSVRYSVGMALGCIGQTKAALNQLERAYALSSGRRDILIALAAAMCEEDRYDEALSHFQTVASEFLDSIDTEFRVSSPDRNINSVPVHLRSFFEDGLCHYDSGEFKEASLAFHAGLSEQKPPISVLLNLGICYIRQSQYDLAIRFLSRARSLSRRNTSVLWNLAVALYRQSLLADCSRVLAEYLRISQQDRRALLCAGYVEYRLGRKGKASEIFERILTLPNPPVETRIVIGAMLHARGRLEEAQQSFQVLAKSLFGRTPDGETPTLESETPSRQPPEVVSVPLNLNKRFYTGSELYEIFSVLTDAQEYERAVEFFRRYAEQHPRYVTPLLLLARVYEQKGDIRKAYKSYLEAASRNPGPVKGNAFVDVATFCLQHGMRIEAKSALNLALTYNPQHKRASDLLRSLETPPSERPLPYYTGTELYAKLERFIEEGRLEEGVNFFSSYAQQHPAYATPMILAARLLDQMGKVEEAAEAYQEAAARAPNVSRRADILVELGKMHLEHQRYGEAKEAFAEALSYQPDHVEARRQLHMLRSLNPPLLYAYWEECRQTGQYEHALKYFQDLVQNAPENHHLWLLIGYAYQNLGEVEKAYEAMARAAELSQSDKIYEKLGWFCLQNQMYAQSRQAYQKALKLNPHSFYARQGLSKISRAMVEGVPTRTEDGKPTMAHLYAVWSQFEEDGLYDQAVEYFRKLIIGSPDFAPTYELLAKAYEALGEKQQGYQALVQMCEVQPSDENYIRLAAYCERNGFVQQAIDAYRKVLRLNPFNTLAKKRLTVLAPEDYPGVEYIAGNEFREDLARDLCRKPWDREAGAKLVEVFVKDAALQEAEATFKLLQDIHPDQSQFKQYLAEVYLKLGEHDKAYIEAKSALDEKETPEVRAILEQVKAEAAPILVGEYDLNEIAPRVAADWQGFEIEASIRSDLEERSPKQVAAEYYKKAGASEDPRDKAHCYLVSARAREVAKQPDLVLRCLFYYARAMSEFHKFEGKPELGQAYLIEAARIATYSAKGDARARLLSQCIVDYFEIASSARSLEEIVQRGSDIQKLIEMSERFLDDRALREFLALIADVVDAIASYMTVDTHTDKAVYNAQALSKLAEARDVAGRKLRYEKRRRARNLLNRWEANLQAERKRITGGAEIVLAVPERKLVPKGENVPLFIDMRNEGKVPAESVVLRLLPSSDYRAEDYEQTVGMLPAGKTVQREFRLILSSRRSRDFDVRFTVEYSDLYTGHKRGEFSTVISVRPKTEPFKPIRSPYIAGPAIPPEATDIFFGRKDVLRTINETLVGGQRDNILVIHGLRRVGKTSILNNLLATMQEPYIPVLIDMQGYSGDDYQTGELLFAIAEIINREVTRRGIKVPPVSEETFLSKPTYAFRRFIDKITAGLAGHRLLLMFDEFEVMIRKVADGVLDPSILDFMRNLMQHQPKLSFLFSGADQLLEMIASYATIMFNLAIPIKISFLDLDSARQLIEEPARRVGVEFHPVAVQRILANTAGQPYFIQLICHHLIQRLNREERRFVTVVDAESVMKELVTSVAKATHFDYLWDVERISLVDRLIMSCIAELSEHDMDWVRQEQILETLQEAGREVSEAQFVSSVVRLQERDIVEEKKAPDGGLEYRIKVNLFRQWFRNHKPLSKTLTEV